MKSKVFWRLVLVLALTTLVAAPATADVPTLQINDLTEPLSATATDFVTSTGATWVPTTFASPEHVEIDGWYNGSGLSVGSQMTYNYNIYDGTPGNPGELSDTLSLTFYGVNTTSNGGGKDSHVLGTFFSATTASGLPGPLENGITVYETGSYQWATTSGLGDSSSSIYGTQISFASGEGVPEPATMLLMGSGLVGLAALRKRFKKA